MGSVEADGLDAALEVVPYEGDNLFVGQVFKSNSDCKIKIAIHAINRKFHFKTKRSTPNFMVLICVAIDCPWRVYAAKVDGSRNFQIRQATLMHSCSVDARRNYHKLATTQVIGELIQSRFIGIKRGPTPATIRKIMLDDFNVTVSYWKSWRSREIAMESVLGSMAGSYALMPAYMGLLQTTNPGSICVLEKTETGEGCMMFQYAFIAFGASIKGYRYMRKLIIIDGTSLKGKCGGWLMSASCQDGNFQNFPLAFAVVDSENDASWEWFLTQLKSFVVESDQLVFVSDRHRSIYNVIGKVYPSAEHTACTVHLWRNIKGRFKSQRLASLMGAAARAYTVEGFNKMFIAIQRVSPGCFDHWSRAHFQGDRYNIMDSNIAESWNAVLKEVREFPLISMCEYIRTTLVSCETEFQVMSQNRECFLVNLLAGTRSCNAFDHLRIPCRHAVAAAGRANIPTESLVAAAYYAETCHSTYEAKIYPIPSVGGNELGGEFEGDLLPPAFKRPPGRPRKVRILSRGEDKHGGMKGCRKCTKCRGEGHNKTTCRSAT
ncbi:PREDICTED: uncharacterized protein LOC106314866 [Brassica oleracea var. oleracea]|uniref:uncharacterized protein LOC106314866 n=1 Tax=Brassica oleracea var. oleracea TaxID=109376 RepID=UPI0006A71FF2|nr:PREDICTED: uncharacterized protein LOC106314866 [Brassica oleracea var. oleracea]